MKTLHFTTVDIKVGLQFLLYIVLELCGTISRSGSWYVKIIAVM